MSDQPIVDPLIGALYNGTMHTSHTIDNIDQYLRQTVPFGFSGAVLIAKGDQILLNQGYGLANREQYIPNTADTVFNLGSITKQFTAAAILKLEMMSLLSTDDLLSKFFPVPKDKSAITLHHLLTHTSGVPDVDRDDFEMVDRDPYVAEILNQPLDFIPGERYQYSNTGYTLLAAVVEMVSRLGYELFLDRYFFQPAGMTQTGYRIPDWDIYKIAHWYVNGVDQGISVNKPYPSWVIIGCGEILSTTTDMFRWHQALMGDAVLSREARQKMVTPNLNHYGYGWEIEETSHGTLIQHNGASMYGSSAHFDRFVDAGWTVVLFCNQDFPGGTVLTTIMEPKIIKRLFEPSAGPERFVPEVVQASSPEEYKGLAGTYVRPGEDASIRVWVEGDALKMAAFGQAAIQTLAIPPGYPPELFATINQRTQEFFQSALEGDFVPFINSGREPGKPRPALQRAITEAAQSVAAERVVVIGSLPSSLRDGCLDCFLLLIGPKGEVPLVFLWDDENTSLGLARIALQKDRLVMISLYPGAEASFWGYHLVSEHTVRARFLGGEDGEESVLVLESEGQPEKHFIRLGTHPKI